MKQEELTYAPKTPHFSLYCSISTSNSISPLVVQSVGGIVTCIVLANVLGIQDLLGVWLSASVDLGSSKPAPRNSEPVRCLRPVDSVRRKKRNLAPNSFFFLFLFFFTPFSNSESAQVIRI
jgi:hypothetical protein